MVSRGGALIARTVRGCVGPTLGNESKLRVLSGCVAGMSLGFDRGFWSHAVIADPWPLSVFLLALVLCLLMMWTRAPDRRRYLYLAFIL